VFDNKLTNIEACQFLKTLDLNFIGAMESPDISAIAGETESFSTSVDVSSKRNLDSEETVGNSESLLAGISSIVDVDPTPSQSREESQSLLMNVGTGNYGI